MMQSDDKRYRYYIDILNEELIPAMGCTEPVAVAYAAAKARDVLGQEPGEVTIQASPNIIKNVKSVVVPNTGGLKGLRASAAAGVVAGKAEKVLEVLSDVDEAQSRRIQEYLDTCLIGVSPLKSGLIFDLIVSVRANGQEAVVRISGHHTNIVLISKNGQRLYEGGDNHESRESCLTDRSGMTIRDIVDFAESVDLKDVEGVLQQQIDHNMAIADEGLSGAWGAGIGNVLLKTCDEADPRIQAKAMAAAGSDARMSGCDLPVVIVSGSGNQGITVSVPVVVFARSLGADYENLLRALVVSNLVTIHQKTAIGRLSAYCGAISAGAGAGAGIAWLHGGRLDEISHTIVNALAVVSGIICDGAKPSCAGKIASAIEAGILGFTMYENGKQFYGGDGILAKGVENTIANVGRLGSRGMRETDHEIIEMMMES